MSDVEGSGLLSDVVASETCLPVSGAEMELEELPLSQEESNEHLEELVIEAEIILFLYLTVHCPDCPYLAASLSNMEKYVLSPFTSSK